MFNGRPFPAPSLFYLFNSFYQFVNVDRFKNVIRRAEVDGANGIITERGNKNNIKIDIANLFDQVKGISPRHFYVEENDIGLYAVDEFDAGAHRSCCSI